jgi:hypothetical protein
MIIKKMEKLIKNIEAGIAIIIGLILFLFL